MVITFSSYVSQIILYTSAAHRIIREMYDEFISFDENKIKGSGEYALYLVLFLIVLNVRLC